MARRFNALEQNAAVKKIRANAWSLTYFQILLRILWTI